MITHIQIREAMVAFALPFDDDHRRRTARAYDIFDRNLVSKAPHQVQGYETWLVDSQYNNGTYTVRIFNPMSIVRATCDCPDFRKGFAGITGLHAGPVCKHIIAVWMERTSHAAEQQAA